MQVTTDILLDAIFLLINDNSTEYKTTVKELIALYEEESKLTESSDQDLLRFYVRVLKTLIQDGVDRSSPDVMRSILLKFKSDKVAMEHRDVINDLQAAFESRETMDSDRLDEIQKKIMSFIIWHRTHKILKKSFSKLMRAAEHTDAETQLEDLDEIKSGLNDVDKLFITPTGTAASQPFDIINLHDPESMREGLKRHQQRNVTSITQTGLQGLNMMFGKRLGIAQGESIVFNALPHMYKSGLLTSCAIWSVCCNIRVVDPETGNRPLVYMASLENEAFQNMVWMFKQRYLVETGQSADGMSDEDILKWMTEYFAKFNTTLIIERHLPSNFGYKEFTERLDYYRKAGYYIVMAIIDYANLMRMGSDDKDASLGGRHLAVRRLFSNLCNFTKNGAITLVTAHPLNRGASDIAQSGQFQNAVKRFGPNHLADSMDVEREVDVSIYVHLETNHALQKFLTMRINKHRYDNDTPETWKYCAYMFSDNGVGILDDIGEKPRYVRDIYVADFDENNLTPAGTSDTSTGVKTPEMAASGLF